MEARQFFLDTATRTFVAGPGAPASAALPTFFAEDVEAIELYFLKAGQFQDYSANTVKLAVGLTAPAAAVTSFSALPTTVTATITTLQAGGSGNNESQRVSFSPLPATGSFSLQFPSRNITVSSITSSTCLAAAHGLFNGQTVALTGFSGVTNFANGDSFFVRDRTSGSFRVATTPVGNAVAIAASSGGTAELGALTTPPIAATATPADVQTAIAAAGLALSGQSQVAVTGRRGDYTLSYQGSLGNIDFAEVAVVNDTLAALPGLGANLSFNTTEVAALISAGTTSGLRFEVEVSDGTLRQTYATPASISSDIITSTSPTPLPANTSFLLQSTSHTWSVSIDDDGILTATKQ